MPRLKGETRQQHMDRIRAARGLPPLTRENLFDQVRAARCYLHDTNRGANRPGLQFQAFMHIFHPGHALTGTQEGLRLAREMDAAERR